MRFYDPAVHPATIRGPHFAFVVAVIQYCLFRPFWQILFGSASKRMEENTERSSQVTNSKGTIFDELNKLKSRKLLRNFAF